MYAQPPPLSPSHQSGSLITIGEPTMTHHYHPQSIVYITAYPWCIFMVLDKSIMIFIYHYSIIQKSFAVLKNLCALYSYPSLTQPLANAESWSMCTLNLIRSCQLTLLVGGPCRLSFSENQHSCPQSS